jgi:serine/threonine protein kinase
MDARGYSGAKVDAWSCGIILYVLVAGALPFDADEMDVLFKLILGGNLNFPAHFSPLLRDLIQNLLHLDPTERFSLEEVLKHSWMAMADEFPGPTGTQNIPAAAGTSQAPVSSSPPEPVLLPNPSVLSTEQQHNMQSRPGHQSQRQQLTQKQNQGDRSGLASTTTAGREAD